MRGRAKTAESSASEARTSEATISRMRWYLQILDDYARRGIPVIASHEIAGIVGMKSGLVRKDLSQFGGFGRPSVGYHVIYLQKKLREILHVDEQQKVAWVGVDHFACVGDRIKMYAERNCLIVAVFDSNPKWVGKSMGELQVLHPDKMEQTVRELGIHAAIIAPSRDNAQDVVDKLVAAGVRAILNVSQSVVSAPAGVFVRNLDVAGELLTLCYLARDRREADQEPAT